MGADKVILKITLDTTRADRLDCYGYDRDTSPRIDALAEESVVHTRAVSTSSWTLPEHASLFTAKFPTSHGALYDPEGPLILTSVIDGPASWDRYRARGLAPDETTLAGLLQDHGYRTAAIVGGPWMKRVFGLDADLRAAVPQDPDLVRAMHEAEIAYMDHHIGRLFDEIRKLGLWDDTWIIVTADHGELLGEHGRFGHGYYLTEPELHIPLIVKYPGPDNARTNEERRAQLTDLLPMIATRLIEQRPDVTEEMQSYLEQFFDGLPPPRDLQVEEMTVDPETIEALKGLGYVN